LLINMGQFWYYIKEKLYIL